MNPFTVSNFTATAGQTVFTLNAVPFQVLMVFVNGLQQYQWSAAGASVTLGFPTASGDIVSVAWFVTTPAPPISPTAQGDLVTEIISDAFLEINVFSPGEMIPAPDIDFALRKLNRLVDNWASKQLYIYANQFQQFTLVPGLLPHTIGTVSNAPTFPVAGNRPTKIIAANLIINSGGSNTTVSSGQITSISQTSQTVTIFCTNTFTTGVTIQPSGLTNNPALNGQAFQITFCNGISVQFSYAGTISNGPETGVLTYTSASSSPTYNIPLNIRDSDWWASQRVQTLTSTYPTDVYYSPDWPNGSLYFWPVPVTAWPVQLETWATLVQFSLTQNFTLPPGYWDAVVYTLAESLIPAYCGESAAQMFQLVGPLAAKARSDIRALNSKAPRMATGGDGLPTGGANRNSFDWRSGQMTGR